MSGAYGHRRNGKAKARENSSLMDRAMLSFWVRVEIRSSANKGPRPELAGDGTGLLRDATRAHISGDCLELRVDNLS